MKQLLFPGMPRPPRPTIRSETVALAVARRIIAEVNLDEFYWAENEIPDRIFDVQHEIMRCGRPATVFVRLERQQNLAGCTGERTTHPYGWNGIDERCRAMAPEIAKEELAAAIVDYESRYGRSRRD